MNPKFGTLVPEHFVELLILKGLIETQAARRAISASDGTGTSIERALLEIGLVPEEPLFRTLAEHLGLPFVERKDLDLGLIRSIGLDEAFLQRVAVVPVREDDGVIIMATTDPKGADILASIGFTLRRPIRPAITSPSTIKQAWTPNANAGVTEDEGVTEADVDRLRALANDGPVIKIVNDLIASAVTAAASDIHIEATEHGARVRYRIDGTLTQVQTIAESARAAVVSRLKVMARLNISEKRRPQDGRADVTVRGRTVDIRLSTLPTQFGESLVLRLLDRSRLRLDWSELGFPPASVAAISEILGLPNGIFLVAGPTGSGKTTTLYTALDQLNSDERKIITVEDPIEFSLKGIAQVQVEPAIDLTFARALRSILRQDPDIIMIGEIRDQETAEIAVRAALVGRLVLSTIHTNDSISAVDRLLDLGIPPFLLGVTLRGVLSQRLVRRRGTGEGAAPRGRIVVSEILRMSLGLAAAVSGGARATELGVLARAEGFKSLRQVGDELVARNVVSHEDLEKAIGLGS